MEELKNEILIGMGDKSIPFEATKTKIDLYFTQKKIQQAGQPFYEDDEDAKIQRWSYYWQSRWILDVNHHGSIAAALDKQKFLSTNFSVCNSSTNGLSWNKEGPVQSCKQDIGAIVSVAVDLLDTNIIYAGTNSGGLWKSIDGGIGWINITDNNISIPSSGTSNVSIPSLGITAVAISPLSSPGNTILYAGTRLTAFTYPGYEGGIGILKSTNGGISWTLLENLVPNPTIAKNVEVIKISFDAGIETIIAAGGKNIYRSIDGGLTWSIFQNPATFLSEFIDLEFNLSNPQYVYASTKFARNTIINTGEGAQFFESNDNGFTWTLKDVPDANYNSPGNSIPGHFSEAIAIDVTPADPTFVYIHFNSGGSPSHENYIKKTTGFANPWTIVKNFNYTACVFGPGIGMPGDICGFDRWCHEFEVSDVTSNIFYVGGTVLYKGVLNTTTNAIVWTQITYYNPSIATTCENGTHADIREIVQIPTTSNSPYLNRERLFIGNDGGIAKTWNGGNYFRNINGFGLGITQFYSIGSFESNDDLIGGAFDNGILANQSGYWSQKVSTDGGWTQMDYEDPTIAYVADYDRILKSTSFSFSNAINNAYAGGVLGRKFNIDPVNHKRLWFGNTDLYMYDPSNQTSDHWVKETDFFSTPSAAPYQSTVGSIGVAASNNNRIFLTYNFPILWGNTPYLNQYKFYRSDDGGATWTDKTLGIAQFYNYFSATDIVVDPNNENRIWISFNSYCGLPVYNRVIYSNDGGDSFSDVSVGLPPYPVNCLAYRNGSNDEIYAGTDAGVYVWNTSINQWECFNQNLPITIVTKIDIGYCKNKITISTFGRGIWQAQLNPVNLNNELHITTNQTWSTKCLGTNVVIEPNATLTIDKFLSMAPGTKITVKPEANLVINGAKLTNTCENMWKGIIVEGGGLIDVDANGTQNAIIENAQYGIDLLTGSKYAIANCTFNRNFIGVRKTGYNLCLNPTTKNFSNVIFDCTQPLKLGYSNQFPIPSTSGFAGIYLDHSTMTLAGSFQGNNYPTFQNLSNGIISIESSAYLKGVFKEIHEDVGYNSLIANANLLANGVGINVQGSSLNRAVCVFGGVIGVQHNFYNCDYSLCSNGTSILMQANTILHSNNNSIRAVGNNISVYFNFLNNVIEGNSGGIEILNPNASINISGNTISSYFSINPLIEIGIANGTQSKAIEIKNNTFFSFGEGQGLRLTKIKNANVHDNNINLIGNASPVFSLRGIEINNCSGTKLKDNSIIGTSTLLSDKQVGIAINNSVNSVVRCNYLDQTSEAIQINGSCYPTDLVANQFRNHGIGLHYDNFGKSGPQDWNGNYWDPASTCVDWQAKHDNISNPNFVLSSNFKVNDSNCPNCFPTNTSSIVPTWFFPNVLQTDKICSNIPDPPPSPDPIYDIERQRIQHYIDSIVATGNLDFQEYNDEVNLMADRELFERIQNNPDLQNEALFNIFYTQRLNSTIYKLERIEELAQDAILYSSPLEPQLDSINQQLESTIQLLTIAEEQLANNTNPAAIPLLQSNFESARLQALILEQQVAQLNAAIVNGLSVIINNASSENKIVGSPDHIEQNEALVNEIYFLTVARGIYNIDANQANQLQAIALECPYGGGLSVYLARALYYLIDKSQNYDDAVLCHEQGYSRKKKPEKEIIAPKVTQSKLTVLPNPADNIIEIKSLADTLIKMNFELYNSLMESVKIIEIIDFAGSTTIPIYDLPPGIYFYRASINSKLHFTNKLIIIHE
ncbi:MAG: hypothetical protein IPO70_03570 [Bacteroidetes bacterium]|nr:hypothetical protein [Bacteroidota bacterium]MBP6411832.1 hypothetical protein [Bacteroidia bacterium]